MYYIKKIIKNKIVYNIFDRGSKDKKSRRSGILILFEAVQRFNCQHTAKPGCNNTAQNIKRVMHAEVQARKGNHYSQHHNGQAEKFGQQLVIHKGAGKGGGGVPGRKGIARSVRNKRNNLRQHLKRARAHNGIF